MVLRSNSSSKRVNKNKQVAQPEIQKPRWLDAFLRNKFFEQCKDHPQRKNELNKYCIDCDQAVCQYCISLGHQDHITLKVYRHVYKDVVSIGTMDKYIDCSEIQRYKSNKRLVISLNPLPHSGSTSNNEASCNTCTRKLNEPNLYRYCSISCKVKAISPEPNDLVPAVIPDQNQNAPQEGMDIPTQERPEANAEFPRPRKRRRKGTPHRAPFF
ncbi:hypothetical protein HN51_050208 [Arachis hypogaea]|uniref:B box-type domain-containing protein n=1 Tax=Arachis hypogaea TaxID=3818 RepID=A0A444YCB0_ARAHY|nr:hypothetical protein Ahy_B07g087493 [Arachis hypogaea]